MSLPQLSSLVVHLKMDEGSGTSLADSSGNGYDATIASGWVWNASPVRLNGTDDAGLTTPSLPALSEAKSYWFRMSSLGDVTTCWMMYLASSPRQMPVVKDGDLQMYSGSWDSFGVNVPTDGVLHNYVFTFDGVDQIKVYVDGVLASTITVINTAVASQGHYYGGYGGSGNGINGDLAGIAIWDGVTLSQTDIDAIETYTESITPYEPSGYISNFEGFEDGTATNWDFGDDTSNWSVLSTYNSKLADGDYALWKTTGDDASISGAVDLTAIYTGTELASGTLQLPISLKIMNYGDGSDSDYGYCRLTFYDSDGLSIGDYVTTDSSVSYGSWETITETATVPAGAEVVRVELFAIHSGLGTVPNIAFDTIEIGEGSWPSSESSSGSKPAIFVWM